MMEEIVQRTADAMVAEGKDFQGVLFAGLMIKNGKVRLFPQQGWKSVAIKDLALPATSSGSVCIFHNVEFEF